MDQVKTEKQLRKEVRTKINETARRLGAVFGDDYAALWAEKMVVAQGVRADPHGAEVLLNGLSVKAFLADNAGPYAAQCLRLQAVVDTQAGLIASLKEQLQRGEAS